jgi:peptide/nickel transport system substrate-binding protein
MRKVTALGLIAAFIFIGACSRKRVGIGGKPDPPFLGEAPEDAAVVDAEPGNYGGTLVIAQPANPKSFNPITVSDAQTAMMINDIVYKSLTEFDNEKQESVPALAKRWEATPDGLHWKFFLRKGVRWSDGEPFTADDVVFTFDVAFDPNVDATPRSLVTQSDGSLPTYEKVDDYTVALHLKEPNALLVAAMTDFRIIPKHKWEAVYKAGNFNQALLVNTDPKDIVGLGPYRITSFASDQKIEYERNPYYWKIDTKGQRLPYIDRVVMLLVPNFNTTYLKFQNGETDMVYSINPDSVDLLKRDERKGDYTIYDLGPSFNTVFLVLNQDLKKYKDQVKLKWFRNVKFRQAVSCAIDREAIVRTVFHGLGVPIYGFDSPANKLWYTDNIPKCPYDPERAKALLKEIGITDRNGDGVAEDAEGHPIRFSLTTNSNNSVRVNIGTLIKDFLSRIGMDVNFQPIDANTLITKLRSIRDFDAAVFGWQVGVPPDPIELKNALLPTADLYMAFPNQQVPSTDWEKELARLIGLCSSTLDLASRQRYYWDAMRIWSENLPEIDLVATKYFVGAKNRFGNFKPSPLANYTYWNIEEIFFKK